MATIFGDTSGSLIGTTKGRIKSSSASIIRTNFVGDADTITDHAKAAATH